MSGFGGGEGGLFFLRLCPRKSTAFAELGGGPASHGSSSSWHMVSRVALSMTQSKVSRGYVMFLTSMTL